MNPELGHAKTCHYKNKIFTTDTGIIIFNEVKKLNFFIKNDAWGARAHRPSLSAGFDNRPDADL